MPIRCVLALLLTCLSGIVGCARTGGTLDISRLDARQVFSQPFEQAWIASDNEGGYDIILVNRALGDTRTAGQTIKPLDRIPVRHVVHAHVLWRARGASRGDDPATGNASVNWYVLTPGATAGEDLLLYRGAGLVRVEPGRSSAHVGFSNVRVSPTIVRGDMTDPLGPSRISGTTRATWDPDRVRAILDQLETLTQSGS